MLVYFSACFAIRLRIEAWLSGSHRGFALDHAEYGSAFGALIAQRARSKAA
jgi:hypothetical protein